MIVNLSVIAINIISGLFFLNRKGMDVNSPKNRKNYIFFVSIILILQSGLRNFAVGADTYAYLEIFKEVKGMSWKDIFFTWDEYFSFGIGKDPGYLIFQKVLQYFLPEYQLFLFAIAIIFFSALGNFIYKNTRRITDVMFAFVLYSILFYPFFSITGHRQTIATAAALYGYELIKRKKLLQFLLLMFIFSSIHKSVLIYIPLYFFRSQKAVKYLLISLALLIPLFFYFADVLSFFFQSVDNNYAAYGHFEELKPYNYVTFNLIIFFLGVITYKQSLKQTIYPDTQFWYAALLLATFFTTQVFQIHGFMRVIYYFSIFNLLLLPHILKIMALKFKISYVQLMAWSIITLLFLYIQAAQGSEYKFFWQEMPLGDNYH